MLATAKIHILKQFTTVTTGVRIENALCLPLQRYTFWSNSQPPFAYGLKGSIVLATAKIHILKQFTTAASLSSIGILLCLPLQRYTFWSNSQLKPKDSPSPSNCACHCKDTHFEAIHNYTFGRCRLEAIVLATAKIHILKQFTTVKTEKVFLTAIVLATAKIHILKQFTTVERV